MAPSRFRIFEFLSLSVVIIFQQAITAKCQHPFKVKGESQYNYLRHSVAVSNNGETYGKHGSTLLGRHVVSPNRIWSSVDDITKSIFAKPDTLDWYSADVGTDGDPQAVTLNAGFSCIDLGLSSSAPISWWVASGVSKKILVEPGINGMNIDSAGMHGSFNDIVVQCLEGRKYEPGRRLVEHVDQHRGTGTRMIKPTGKNDKPLSLVGDDLAFERLRDIRMQHDPSDEVVYDSESGIAVAVGLPFDSGFRIHAPEDMTTEKTRDFRVPMTPLGGLTTHIGARLRESRVARGESRTSTALLLLTVWASGLAFLLAIWIMAKTVTDILVARSERLRSADVHTAVLGSEGWTMGEKVTIVTNFVAVTILLTPFGQAIAEGNIDPRAAIEVHYGANVYYTDSGILSKDEENPIAGAIFFVSTWVTVRPLDDGYARALALSLSVIMLFAFAIFMRVTKKTSETMRSSRQLFPCFSVWKFVGYMRMCLKSKAGRNMAKYKVFVRLRADAYPLEGGEYLEHKVKEIALLCDETWRRRANTAYKKRKLRDLHRATLKAARCAAHEGLADVGGKGCIGLYARVQLDDRRRFAAATGGTGLFQNAMTRNWEYLRRGVGCESIEWYRTNGQFPPDATLVVMQLGLLPYAKYISSVSVADDAGGCEYDGDDVECLVGVADAKEEEMWRTGWRDAKDGVPRFVVAGGEAGLGRVFRERVQGEEVEVHWSGGSGGTHHVPYPESSMRVRYFVARGADFAEEGFPRESAGRGDGGALERRVGGDRTMCRTLSRR